MAEQLPEVLDLNVGGMHATTTRTTLTKYPDSMLAAMFSGRHVINKDKDGRYVIDCDGKIFRHILEFLRCGTLPPVAVAEAVYKYSEYFQLNELSELLCTFQPVNRSLGLTRLKKRSKSYEDFSKTVIESLSGYTAQKNDNILITVAREGCHRNQFIDNVRQDLQYNIHPLACLEVDISDFDHMQQWTKDELLFMTADQLQTLGYGSNILYYLGGDYEPSLILICNIALSKLQKYIHFIKFNGLLIYSSR